MFNYINGLPSNHPFNEWNQNPRFDALDGKTALEGIEAFQAQALEWIKHIEAQGDALDLDAFLKSYDSLNKRLEEFNELFGSLPATGAYPSLDAASQTIESINDRIKAERDLNSSLYQALLKIKDSPRYTQGNKPFQYYIGTHIARHERNGVNLPSHEKSRLNTLAGQIRDLEIQFGQNNKAAEKAWHFQIKDKNEITGLPKELTEIMKKNAQARNMSGYVLTMQNKKEMMGVECMSNNPALQLRLKHAKNIMGTAACPLTRQYDTQPIIRDILKLRHEKAQLLGYKTYAHYKAAQTALKTPENIEAFLKSIAEKTVPKEKKQKADSKAILQKHFQLPGEDYLFEMYHEGLFRHHVRNQENLSLVASPIINEDAAYQTLFNYLNRYFGLRIEEISAKHAWGDDVRAFEVFSQHGDSLGQVYCDIGNRPGKLAGAQCIQARVPCEMADGAVKPIGIIIADFPRDPETQKVQLQTHDFSILLHEFGHYINMIASGNNHENTYAGQQSMNSVSIDGAEMPSQFLEIKGFAKPLLTQALNQSHPEGAISANTINEELFFSKFAKARMLNGMVKQMLYDLKLHWRDNSEVSESLTRDIHVELHRQYPTSALFSFENPSNTFLHAFFHRYECVYYSYLWTLVMAVNIAEQFKDKPIDDPEVGRKLYDEVYAIGGGEDFYERFKKVYGGEINIDAFLAHFDLDKPHEENLKAFTESLEKVPAKTTPPKQVLPASTSAPVLRQAPWQQPQPWGGFPGIMQPGFARFGR